MAQPKDFWDWPFHWQLLLWPLALGAWIEDCWRQRKADELTRLWNDE